jgi:hypothetical protein
MTIIIPTCKTTYKIYGVHNPVRGWHSRSDVRGNPQDVFAPYKPCQENPGTIDIVLIRTGLAQKWEEQGIEKGRAEGRTEERKQFVRNLLAEGMSIEKIAAIAELSVEKVRELAQKPHQGG